MAGRTIKWDPAQLLLLATIPGFPNNAATAMRALAARMVLSSNRNVAIRNTAKGGSSKNATAGTLAATRNAREAVSNASDTSTEPTYIPLPNYASRAFWKADYHIYSSSSSPPPPPSSPPPSAAAAAGGVAGSRLRSFQSTSSRSISPSSAATTFTTTLRMFSDRTLNTECIAHENRKGKHMGAGTEHYPTGV